MYMDSSNAEHGKFYHSDTPLNIPVFLDQNNDNWFSEKIETRHVMQIPPKKPYKLPLKYLSCLI